MREVDGFVVTAGVLEAQPHEVLFGENTDPTFDRPYLNITGNNITPFDNLEQARKARAALEAEKRRGFGTLGLARLRMIIASDEEEIQLLSEEPNLVAILVTIMVCDVGNLEILGEPVEGALSVGYIPGSPVEYNGFKPFLDPKQALYSLHEIGRQGGCRGHLATFELTRLS